MLTRSDGRQVLRHTDGLVVTDLELTGRPDGLRPSGFESYLEMLLARPRITQQHQIPVRPQEWMELDREFTVFAQRRHATMQGADECLRDGQPGTARRLYRVAQHDAQHGLSLVEFAARTHPSGGLTAANTGAIPTLLSCRAIAAAYAAALDGDLTGALGALTRTGEEIRQILGPQASVDPMSVASLRDLRVADQALRGRFGSSVALIEQRTDTLPQ